MILAHENGKKNNQDFIDFPGLWLKRMTIFPSKKETSKGSQEGEGGSHQPEFIGFIGFVSWLQFGSLGNGAHPSYQVGIMITQHVFLYIAHDSICGNVLNIRNLPPQQLRIVGSR